MKKPVVAVLVTVLSIISFLLLTESTGEEPFLRFQSKHVWTQLVGPTIIMTIWIELFVWIAYGIVKGRYKLQSILLLVWIAFALFWLMQIPITYISDIEKFNGRVVKDSVDSIK